MKNLNDIAEDYRDSLLNKIEELKDQITDMGKWVFMIEEDKQDLIDQVGHAIATVEEIDVILSKVDDPIPEIVVDIRGGLVQAVYSNTTGNKIHLYMVDWDNIGVEREYLHCLPHYGEPNHIDNENWDIPHLFNLWKEEHMKNLEKWDKHAQRRDEDG